MVSLVEGDLNEIKGFNRMWIESLISRIFPKIFPESKKVASIMLTKEKILVIRDKLFKTAAFFRIFSSMDKRNAT